MTSIFLRKEESPLVTLNSQEIAEGKGIFLVDTGAELNLVKKCRVKLDSKINTRIKYHLFGIGEQSIETRGEIFLIINGTPCPFQVVPNGLAIPHDGMIGMPFLKNAVIDLEGKEIKHALGNFPFNPEDQSRTFRVSARTKQLISIPVSNPAMGEGYLPRVNIGPGIFLGEALTKVKNNEIKIFCFNTTSREIFLSLPPLTLEEFDLPKFYSAKVHSITPVNKLKCTKAKKFNELVSTLDLSNLNSEERSSLLSLLAKYSFQFYLKGDQLGCTNVVKHRILTTDEIPVNKKSFRAPPIHKEVITKEVASLSKNMSIVPSESPYNSPVWVVPKKPDSEGNKRWRMVINYRALNEKTIADAYPLPNITDILDQLGGAKHFSVFIWPKDSIKSKLILQIDIKQPFLLHSGITSSRECRLG